MVPEDDGGGASGAVDEGSGARLPDVDTAERDDVVPEDDEGGATGSAATAPAPTGLRVTSDTDDSVSLSWNAVTDAGAYKVEYRRSSSSTWLHANYVYSRTTETVDGLDCNTSYYFRVRARGDGSPYSFTYGTASSSASETTDGCPLPTAPRPTGLRVTSDTDDSVSLSWNAVTDAGAYKVEYRRSSSSSWLHAGYVFSGTTETVDGLNCDTSYYFRVRARNRARRSDGMSAAHSAPSHQGNSGVTPAPTELQHELLLSGPRSWRSSSVSETTDGCPLPTAPRPTGLRVTSDTDDSVSLSWSAVTNAAVYKVEYRRSGSSSWLHASYVYSGTTETVDGLDCDTSYYFRVRARGDGSPYSTSYGDASSSVSETTDGCTAPAPTGLRATSDTDDSVSLSWSAVTNSAVYKVEYRRSGSSSWLHASYVYSGTTETVDGLDCDTSYYFRVRARGDGSPYSTSYGDASSSVSETTDGCTAPAPTGLRVTSDTDDSVSLSWSAVTNAAVYKVEYRRSGSISWLHASYVYSGTTETVDGLDCDTSYYFRVRARGDGSPYSTSYGDASSSVSETTDGCTVAPAPTGLSATASAQTSVTLSWNPVTDAQYYRLERSTSRTGPWTGISSTIVGTSRTVYGLECNTLYYFKVSARGDGHPYSTTFGQQSSGDVSRRTTECPGAPAPIGLEVTASTDTTVTLEWFWVRDAQHYKLERRLDGSTSWTLADAGADSITTNSYTVTGLACNTTYRFRVSAHGDGHPYSNSFGSPSPSSNPRTTSACATPAPAPTGLRATASTETSVSLRWNPVTDAYRYRVEYSESNRGPWTAETETSSASDTVHGLDCNTTYYFTVRTRGDGSPYSTIFSPASTDVSRTTSSCPNMPPTFNPVSFSFSVNEDAANGTPVGTVSATDPDAGDTITYSIIAGNGGGKFTIDSTTGEITVADLLDHEADASYSLTVQAEDTSGATAAATISITVTDVFESVVSIDIGSPVAGQSVTMTASTDAPAGNVISYQWQELSGSQWVDVGPASAEKLVSFNTATTKTYRAVGTYGTDNSADSPPVTIEWRALTVIVEVDPAAPTAGATVTMTAVTDAPEGVTLSYQWQENMDDSWSDLTSTNVMQTATSTARGAREFRVIVSYGAAFPAESPSEYVIWDERDIVTDMIEDLIADVVATTAYTTAETSFLSCVNAGRASDDTYGSFEQVMVDYPDTTAKVAECEGRTVSPTTMFETIKDVSRQKLGELKTANATYAAILETAIGREFEQSLGAPEMMKQDAMQLAAVIASDEAAEDTTQATGQQSTPDSHGFEGCLPSDATTQTLSAKFDALNCLLFSKPHSLWVSLHDSEAKKDAFKRDLDRFNWLDYDNFACSNGKWFDPADGLPCKKHDVAYASLQRFVPFDYKAGPSETLDAGWNPRNKYLADLMFIVDGICGMAVGDQRRECIPEAIQDHGFFKTLIHIGWWIPKSNHWGVNEINDKRWPLTKQDSAHAKENLEYVSCDMPRLGSYPSVTHKSGRTFDVSLLLVKGCVQDITVHTYKICYVVSYSGWGPDSTSRRCTYLSDSIGTFDVPWSFWTSWSSLRVTSVAIRPNDRSNEHLYYPTIEYPYARTIYRD